MRSSQGWGRREGLESDHHSGNTPDFSGSERERGVGGR